MTPSSNFADDLEVCLGAQWKRYVLNKRKGGDNARKGIHYENFYCAYQLAKTLCGLLDGADVASVQIELQAQAIVDDLVISFPAITNYFQCKNASSVSWVSGDHPIKDDFAAQMNLFAHQQKNNGRGTSKQARTILVVPDKAMSAALSESTPREIVSHTDVVCFPFCDGVLNRLVFESHSLRLYLARLARVEDARHDELTDVLGALLYGISKSGGSGTVWAMLEGAQSISPHLIRLMPQQLAGFSFLPGVQEQLAAVRGLNYDLSRGFLRWSGYGTSGTLPYNCLDEQFVRFQERILELKPSTFDAFEGLL